MTEQILNNPERTKNFGRLIRVLVNSFAFAFIDTDYLNMAKMFLPVISPVLLLSAQMFISEISPVLNLAAKALPINAISKGIGCGDCGGSC